MTNVGNLPQTMSFNIPENAKTNTLVGLTIPDQYHANFQLFPNMKIPDGCCLDLSSASFPYSIPNIGLSTENINGYPNGNNRFSINWDNGGYVDVILATGLYGYGDVQIAMNQFFQSQGYINPGTNLITLVGIQSTQQIVMIVDPTQILAGAWGLAGQTPTSGFIISFVSPSPTTSLNDSIAPVLGFNTANSAFPTGGIITLPNASSVIESYNAPLVADFAETTAINLYCNFVSRSYINGSVGQLAYSFALGQFAPNTIASYQASLRYPVPLQAGDYSNATFWFTDNRGNLIKLAFFQGAINFSFIISKNKSDGSY